MLIKLPQKREPLVRVTISVKRSTVELLDAYAQYVQQTQAVDLDRSALIQEIVIALCDRDVAFKKAMAERLQTS